MAADRFFDDEMERIASALEAHREALRPAAAMLAEAAMKGVLPEEERIAGEFGRLKAGMQERQGIEAALARLVAGLSADIEYRARQFDNREVPTRFERLIGTISRKAMLRRQRARWRRGGSSGHLARLLKRADLLVGLVRAERQSLVAERIERETALVAFIDHRPEIIRKLRGEDGEAMAGVEAVRRTEECVDLFQSLVDGLNVRAGTCNVMLHKLLVDVEDLLILCQVVSAVSAGRGDEAPKPDDFPHLASEIQRFSKSMLTVHGLDRRRVRANQAFAERFPAPTGAEPLLGDSSGRRTLPPSLAPDIQAAPP